MVTKDMDFMFEWQYLTSDCSKLVSYICSCHRHKIHIIWALHQSLGNPMVRVCLTIVSRGGWFRSSIVFQDDAMVMFIGESDCYWLEKGNSMDTWWRRTCNMWRWRTTLIKSKHCYWMTASLYKKYNTFSDRENDQHRTMTFAELPNHPLLLTMVWQSRSPKRPANWSQLYRNCRKEKILYQYAYQIETPGWYMSILFHHSQ